MRYILSFVLLIFTPLVFAENEKLPELKLKNGKSFSVVTITKKTPEGIAIRHESGTARIPFEQLPDDLAKKLGGFDSAAAAKSRDEANIKEAATLAWIDKDIAAEQAAREKQAVIDSARPALLHVIQATPDGVLCRISWYCDIKTAHEQRDAFNQTYTTYTTSVGTTGYTTELNFVEGIEDAVDGVVVKAALTKSGTYQYKLVSGAGATVQKWIAVTVQGSERRPATTSSNAEPKVTGTGFLITQNGYLVTNHHVVKDSDKVRVQTASGLLNAVVIRTDSASDLALLKVTGTFDALPVVSSRNSRLGSTVATVGFPNIGLQGFEPKLSKGDISSLAGIHDDVKQFQISVPVQPGNSGGALVDECGNVVGVVCAQLSQKAALESSGTLAQSVNYAVKSSYLLSFLEAVPEVSSGLLDTKTNDQKFEAVVDDVKKATVLIIGY